MLPLPLPYMDDNPREGEKAPVVALMLANAALSFFRGPAVYAAFGFVPDRHAPLSFVTSEFLHADGMHLAGNMWFLWLFGDNVAAYLGRWFLPFYLASGIAANLGHWLAQPGSPVPAIGASGSISGVIGAYLVLFPGARLRCVSFARAGSVSFTMSALMFGLMYFAAQWVMLLAAADAEVAYGAHLGGLAFGAVVGFALKRPAGEASAMALSGPLGARPLAAVAGFGAASEVESAIRAGREHDALAAFTAAVRRDPGFELSADAQLWAADRLARAGHPHLALSALEKFIARHPDAAASPNALLLLGFVAQAGLGDLERAVGAYRKAAAHPMAAAALQTDAAARLAAAEALLHRTFTEAPREDETYAVLMEGSADPTPEQAGLVAEAAGDQAERVAARLAKGPGFLLRWMKPGEAGALADRLEAAGLPVVVVPESGLSKPPPAVLCGLPEAAAEGLRLQLSGGEVAVVPWAECLLIAAGGVGFPKSSPKQQGLFEIGDVFVSGGMGRYGRRRRSGAFDGLFGTSQSLYETAGPVQEYTTENVHIPVLDLLRVDGSARYRWSPALDLEVDAARVDAFFDGLQDIVLGAPGVPVERGALGAFDRRFSERSVFPDVAAWDAYLTWQVQLAALKRRG